MERTEWLEKQAAEKQEAVEDLLKEVSKIRTTVRDAVEDGVESALKAIKQGRETAEDVLDDAKRAVKRNPFEAVGIVFVAGVFTGCLAAWIGMSRRD
ncbi:MAG TPA: hypothetical protein VHW46_17445 [Terracidiphilus sp.]|jgi:ElaB/YqjD/DUF883 family membrane-anchored ribosome-binding protein|nr:hypothetical protein [Terracidiphilus sp.]